MYDPLRRRFHAVDPFRGYIENPTTMIQYIYVLNNPLYYIDPDGMRPYSFRTRDSSGRRVYTLRVTSQHRDLIEDAVGFALGVWKPLVGLAYQFLHPAAMRGVGYRRIGYNIEINDVAGATAAIVEWLSITWGDSFGETAGRRAGWVSGVLDLLSYGYDWIVTHNHRTEEALFNSVPQYVWFSPTRNIVDDKFRYGMHSVNILMALGIIEVRRARDVFGGRRGRIWRYDPLSGQHRWFNLNNYYFFPVLGSEEIAITGFQGMRERIERMGGR